MRFLKFKILRTQRKIELSDTESCSSESSEESAYSSASSPIHNLSKKHTKINIKKLQKKKKKTKHSINRLANKNIAKNYGRAIANFAASSLAMPYIEDMFQSDEVLKASFREYALSMRDFIQNLETLRDAMVAHSYDSEMLITFKAAFQKAAEVFMKYFSVNWIFSGKLLYKHEYLKQRGKILRRVMSAKA